MSYPTVQRFLKVEFSWKRDLIGTSHTVWPLSKTIVKTHPFLQKQEFAFASTKQKGKSTIGGAKNKLSDSMVVFEGTFLAAGEAKG